MPTMQIEIEYPVKISCGEGSDYMEVIVKVSCEVEKGEPRTFDHPGCEDSLIDLEYDYDTNETSKKGISAMDLEAVLLVEGGSIAEKLWEEVKNIEDGEER